MGSARWSHRALRRFVTPPPPSPVPRRTFPLARRSLAPHTSQRTSQPTSRVMSCATPSALASGQSGSCAARAHTWGRALVLGEGLHKGAPPWAYGQMGPRYPSSERGKWPLCLSPIRGAAGFAPQPREARGAGATMATWWDGHVSDIRTARNKQQLVVYIINQSTTCGEDDAAPRETAAIHTVNGLVPSPWARARNLGSGARAQPSSPLAHLPVARGFPGTRPPTPTTTSLRSNGSYCSLLG